MQTPLRFANRPPNNPLERLTVKREEAGGWHWHARDAQGELIAKDQWQNDLIPGLRKEGFNPIIDHTRETS